MGEASIRKTLMNKYGSEFLSVNKITGLLRIGKESVKVKSEKRKRIVMGKRTDIYFQNFTYNGKRYKTTGKSAREAIEKRAARLCLLMGGGVADGSELK
jgi:hypothetical protein